jgi:acetyltransferase
MSNRSRQQRFAAPLQTLTDNQLEHLTRLDESDRVAWCAFVQSESEERGIGLARYVRLEDETNVAEFAVTVVDEFQGQGIGTELLNQLIETAKSNSIHTLRGYILPHNEAMLTLCRRLNAHTVREDASTIRADIQIQS